MKALASMTDEPTHSDLLTRCRGGDRAAMRDLYEQNHRRVFSVAMNYFGGNRDMAEDITQKVFLKLLTKLDFHGRSEFTTWLYRLTVNQCIDETRKTRRLLPFGALFGLAEPVTQMSLNDGVDTREISTQVQAVVAGLKPKYRLPIVLKYVEGLSYQQIGDVLEISPGTVASRLNRGHKLLAAKLGHLRGELR